MRTWWQSLAHRPWLLTGLSLLLLATLSVPAVMRPGSFDDLVVGPARAPCGYLKIFRWRDTDPRMIVPRPSADRSSTPTESSPFVPVDRVAGPVPITSSGGDSYPSDCHPIPRFTPIDRASP